MSSKSDSSKLRSSRFSRLAKIGGTVAKAASSYAIGKAKEKAIDILDKTEKVKSTAYKIKVATEIIQSMGELKGGIMKVGQMLASTEDLILPKELSNLFRTLQRTSPPMPDSDLDSVFMDSFAKRPEELFDYFNRKQIAAASIGQVHEAILKTGEKVAVKIQYPKISDAIKNDLSSIDQLDKLFSLFIPGKPDIKKMIVELQKVLILECDYEREKTELKRYKEIFEKEFADKIIIPKVYDEFTSDKILTVEYLEGDTYEETLENYTQEQKNELGELLYNSFLYSFCFKRRLHTDPQNGNYLFRPGKILMMDFGSTRYFQISFVQNFCLLQLAAENNNFELYKTAAKKLEICAGEDSDELIMKQFEVIRAIYYPYCSVGKYSVDDNNPFKILKDFLLTIDIAGRKVPREEFLLLDRANIGLYTKLRNWKAEVDWEKGRLQYRYKVSDYALKSL